MQKFTSRNGGYNFKWNNSNGKFCTKRINVKMKKIKKMEKNKNKMNQNN